MILQNIKMEQTTTISSVGENDVPNEEWVAEVDGEPVRPPSTIPRVRTETVHDVRVVIPVDRVPSTQHFPVGCDRVGGTLICRTVECHVHYKHVFKYG